MLFLIVLVFVGVFLVVAMLLMAGTTGRSQQAKQTLANLESALATASQQTRDQIVDIRRSELLSAVPWINRLLAKVEIAPQIRLWLYQANLGWTAGGLILMTIACFVVFGYLVYLRTGGIAFGFVLGLVAAAIPGFWVMRKRRKRFDEFEGGLPEALDLMVSALRAGHSLVAALRLVAHESPDPIGGEFRICFEEQNYGLELRTAMENLTERVPLQDLRIVTTAILIQKESGGNLAEVLEKGANLIRERFKLKREVRTRTAQGRLTGWILSILPLVMGLLLYMINPKVMSVLWTRDIGIKLLYGAAGLMVFGGLIIRKIVNMEV
ncbi:MAG TPA: type II secretion system F family protein [Acidobacteriaceae bacterium]|nr:type II secretion system F family protein [Acidobacteriaceae bacterium]